MGSGLARKSGHHCDNRNGHQRVDSIGAPAALRESSRLTTLSPLVLMKLANLLVVERWRVLRLEVDLQARFHPAKIGIRSAWLHDKDNARFPLTTTTYALCGTTPGFGHVTVSPNCRRRRDSVGPAHRVIAWKLKQPLPQVLR